MIAEAGRDVAGGRRDRRPGRRPRPPPRRARSGGPCCEPADGHPGQRAHRGGGVGDDEGDRGQPVRGERAAGVEAEPAEPEQAGAEHGHRQVVRLHRLLAEADALAEHERGDQRRDAGGDVHDRAAGEVERAQLVEPAAGAPDPVRDRVVDERRPEQAEEHERLEALALGERAGDQRRRDDGEHHLEDHEGWCGIVGA